MLPPLFICFSQNRPHRVPSYPAAVTWQRRRNLPDKPHVFRCAARGLYSPVLCHCLAPAGSSLMTNLDPVLRSGHSFFYFFISLRHFFLFVKGFPNFVFSFFGFYRSVLGPDTFVECLFYGLFSNVISTSPLFADTCSVFSPPVF